MSLVQTQFQSLRDRQIASLEHMLNLNVNSANTDLTSSSNFEEIIWKVLVLDTKSTAIVSSILRVNDLLRCGIAIHSMINSKRSPLPDVPVVYFVEPTIDNISKIISDLENDYYSSFYINFTSSLKRELLEEFAKKVALSGKSFKIKQVYDQYLDFIVTEPDLFSLDIKKIYSKFNNPNTTEDEIQSIADQISNGIFASIITMKNIPIIRCPRGGPAEMIAEKLNKKLRDYVINTKTSSSVNHSNSDSLQRSVLVLLDRNIDLSAMFAHSWIYQCMVSDVFHLSRNTITIESKDEKDETKIVTKQYDIDPKDFFWAKNALSPFPEAVENVELELSNYKKDAKEISSKTGYSSLSDIDPNSTTDTVHIQQAIKALPELTSRKNIIDMHMKVLASLLSELESKNLDSFFEIEQNFNDPKVQKQFLEILEKKSKGNNLKDKFRTYLILLLSSDLPPAFQEKCDNLLKEEGIEDLSSLNYIRRVKEVTKLSTSLQNGMNNNLANSNSSQNNNSALFTGLSSKLYGLTDGRISEGFGSLITGLKKLLPEKNQMPITKIVESIMEPLNSSQENLAVTDDYLYFDPKHTRGVGSQKPKRQSYNEAIVFVVGGGNYLEYSNLQEWVNGNNNNSNSAAGNSGANNSTVSGLNNGGKLVVYGSTDIITANEFLEECSELGKA
ncbi:hypothetical protein PACTADRAFT_47779 [Pachysolen tannophilus NRRL Y-2460]|uniref:Uncharacterized protein n=1 Tax=Pachysolen tannophilus NRRL Y-2460 TaxID=669874 RepID=A0A1E4U1S0_PACTA|nr:hypothetical protein PACTADRAFT_47779 [Pachysolen tannophilus NRRL Y-2460]